MNHNQVIELYLKLKDVKKITEIFNCNETTIYKILKKNNIKLVEKIIKVEEYDKIIKLYSELKDQKKVAKFFNCSTAKICLILKKNNIERVSKKRSLEEKYGKQKAEEMKEKCRQRFLGENNPSKRLEIKEIRSKMLKERWKNPEYRESQTKFMQEYSNKPEVKKKRGQLSRNLWKDEKWRKKLIESMKISHNKPESIKKSRDSKLKMWSNPEIKAKKLINLKNAITEERNIKVSEGRKKLWKNPEFREKMIPILTQTSRNANKDKDFLKAKSEMMKGKWSDEEWRKKTIEASLKGLFKRPTSFEQKIILLCSKYRLPFIYSGDGRILVGYKNPDFIDEKNKMIIEVFLNYFKEKNYGSIENYIKQRGEYFKKYGYKTIFIREEEIMDRNWEKICLNKLKGINNVQSEN